MNFSKINQTLSICLWKVKVHAIYKKNMLYIGKKHVEKHWSIVSKELQIIWIAHSPDCISSYLCILVSPFGLSVWIQKAVSDIFQETDLILLLMCHASIMAFFTIFQLWTVGKRKLNPLFTFRYSYYDSSLWNATVKTLALFIRDVLFMNYVYQCRSSVSLKYLYNCLYIYIKISQSEADLNSCGSYIRVCNFCCSESNAHN